ncbi:type II toxin-antitoxin system RelE/ParE family toxin [Caballeronia sp. dw_19]|uniref:type II toxin-antitoxin system RelE/ParE family toxin n=1 Tax=unclassified Caballeronia TaxID=2646786 RepID=UPI001BD32344|nr:type II toxin-antitoxin system RelE/ParE family toxin [Caballeronia sp. dw_19]
MNLTILDSAKRDLADLRDYIARHKPKGTWSEIKTQLQSKIFQIEDFPLSGACPPELLGYPDRYRQVLTNQQRIIYEIAGDQIFIHVICGQTQDLEETLNLRLLSI